MKSFSRISTVAILTLLLSFGFVFGAYGRTVVDGLGRKVTVEGTPDRIITTIVSTTEIALDLGLSDRLVGITSLTQYLSYVPELQKQAEKIEGIGEFTISMEKIVELNPDFAIVDGSAQKDMVDKISDMGITVFATTADDIEEVKRDILEIGYLTGTLERAQEIVAEMEYKEMMLDNAVARLEERKTVFYTVSKQMYTTGDNTFVGRALDLAGLENVFSDISGWKPASNEEIVNRNPDLIIATEDMGLDASTLKDRPGFKGVKAVKEGNVLLLPRGADSNLNQPATKIIDGIINLFEMAYDREVEL